MATVILKATNIDDFDRWRAGFEENAPRRSIHGFLSYVMCRDATDPTTVVVISRVESLEKARGLFQDPEVRATMIRAGAKGPPEWLLLDDVASG